MNNENKFVIVGKRRKQFQHGNGYIIMHISLMLLAYWMV